MTLVRNSDSVAQGCMTVIPNGGSVAQGSLMAVAPNSIILIQGSGMVLMNDDRLVGTSLAGRWGSILDFETEWFSWFYSVHSNKRFQ
jgi:hypothetical protein